MVRKKRGKKIYKTLAAIRKEFYPKELLEELKNEEIAAEVVGAQLADHLLEHIKKELTKITALS